MVDHPPSKSRPLSSARQEAHTKESRSRVCAAFDVLEGQLSTSGRLRVLQVARHVQDRVIHAGRHSRPSQCQTGAIAPTHERDMSEAKVVWPDDRPSSTAAGAIARPWGPCAGHERGVATPLTSRTGSRTGKRPKSRVCIQGTFMANKMILANLLLQAIAFLVLFLSFLYLK